MSKARNLSGVRAAAVVRLEPGATVEAYEQGDNIDVELCEIVEVCRTGCFVRTKAGGQVFGTTWDCVILNGVKAAVAG